MKLTKHLLASLVGLGLLLLGGLGSLQAQDLLYSPSNPAFGGNTFNYQWLLSSATAQNGLTDPDAADPVTGRFNNRRTSLDDFTETLNRQLLNSVTRQLFDAQFGSGGLQPGTFTLGNFQVEVVETAGGLSITIIDIVNGGTTEVTIPNF